MAHNGGRLQANCGASIGYFQEPFLNLAKMGEELRATNNALGDLASTDDGWPAYLDSNGYPTAMPPGSATRWVMPRIYAQAKTNDEFKLVYPSQHTVTLIASAATISEIDSTAGAKVFQVTSGNYTDETPYDVFYIRITAMSGSDWTGGIKLIRTKRAGVATGHEALLNAGEIWEPTWLANFGYGNGSNIVGTLRLMDMGLTNENYARDLSLFNSESRITWMGTPCLNADIWAGQATKTAGKNNYTTGSRFVGNPVAWVDGQAFAFRLGSAFSTKTATAITAGNPTSFSCTSHGLTTGDKISIIDNFNMSASWVAAFLSGVVGSGLPPLLTVTVSDANTFTVAINSTGYGNLTNISFYPEFTVGDGTLTAKRVVRHNLSGYLASSFSSANDIAIGWYDSHIDAVIIPDVSDKRSKTQMGAPISAMCKLANKMKAHAWFCMPFGLNNSAMQSYATTVKATLDTDILACFAVGNEVWNSIFPAFNAAQARSAKEYSVWTNGAVNGYAWAFDRMVDALAAVYTDSNAYRTVYELQAANPANTWLQATTVSGGVSAEYPANKADWIAIAPYYNVEWYRADTASTDPDSYTGWSTAITNYLAGGASRTAAYDWMANEIRSASTDTGEELQIDDMAALMASWTALLANYRGRRGAAYGLKLVCYEGGFHLWQATNVDGSLNATNVYNFLQDYLDTTQHATVNVEYFQELVDNGVYIPSQFAYQGYRSASNMFNLHRLNPGTSTNARDAALVFSGTGLPAHNATFTLTTG
jgi:hypothetical protein